MKNKLIERSIVTLGFAGLFTCTFCMLLTFYIAYFNDYEVLVAINVYNEAKMEFIMFLVLIPCMIYVLSMFLHTYSERIKGNK